MSKKTKRPEAGDHCRNKFSGRIHHVTRISPVRGWFQLDGERGWSQWEYFTPVSKETAERELRGKEEDV